MVLLTEKNLFRIDFKDFKKFWIPMDVYIAIRCLSICFSNIFELGYITASARTYVNELAFIKHYQVIHILYVWLKSPNLYNTAFFEWFVVWRFSMSLSFYSKDKKIISNLLCKRSSPNYEPLSVVVFHFCF